MEPLSAILDFSVNDPLPDLPNFYRNINLGDQGMCRSPKKLKSLIEVPYVVDVKVQVLSFNKKLIFSP